MRFIFGITFILLSTTTFSQVKLRAYLDDKQFYAPEVGNYVEFQLQFVGTSAVYFGVEDGLKCEIAVFMDVYKDTSIIRSDAYRLQSPLMKDSIVEDFYDIKRFQLDPGTYSLTIKLQDLNSEEEPLVASQNFVVKDYSSQISISDVEVAEAASIGDGSSMFFKSGYDIIPRLSTFYPSQLNTIPIYFEIYNSNLIGDSVFGVKQYLIDAKSGNEIEGYSDFSRVKAGNVIPVFRQMNIENLMTGKYIVKYEVVTQSLIELATQQYEFERSNDKPLDLLNEEIVLDPSFQASITRDSVGFYLESLIPISGATDVKNIIEITKGRSEDDARKYIQLYWNATSPNSPYEAWLRYKQQVQLVEKIYSNNFQEGFETDRGRVYLQYGSPTEIVRREHSANEYPYEIWQYNKIGVFSNKRFIFYNPNLVNNVYNLLHSDMVGELKNPSWPTELVKRNTTNGSVNDPNSNNTDRWGTNSGDLFKQ